MSKVKHSLQDCDRSWSIHIYNGRHLMGSLYPSHAWIFLLGATLSGLLIFASSQVSNCTAQPSRPDSSNSSPTPSPSPTPQPSQVTPPFQVD
ncbi:hypothetical protein [Acaryochloris sp. CCMEE 5410]|uniref:hypothetical protein n=1 Tax=Acaryochloris sp. CCMEE 5410 TaxID=310037 RepID=UPI0002483E06|nr:hypothetical protein [Acaryochloris sp. CCMEE 5410]KAI9133629.1 hypothetical protein ON05_010175 [Acaryochloris sp. CCMEE 5410]